MKTNMSAVKMEEKMATSIINVQGMSCEHCVKAVEGAATALSGVSGAKADLQGGTVTVDYDPALVTTDQIKDEIEMQGYDTAE
jgi:copper chaperone